MSFATSGCGIGIHVVYMIETSTRVYLDFFFTWIFCRILADTEVGLPFFFSFFACALPSPRRRCALFVSFIRDAELSFPLLT